jgi:hypothetical protein
VGLDFSQGPKLGHVVRVESDRIVVEVTNLSAIPHVTVSDLVALVTGTEFLIAIVDKINRGAVDGDTAGSTPAGEAVRLGVMPVGTFRPGNGKPGVFRRGAASYPHIGGGCHLIDGERRQGFMLLLGDEVDDSERLVLGRYATEHQPEAVADGNALFQRHLALLGSTGSGKSWAVASMLERAARLGHTNMIVFDLHGEYWPLTRPGPNGEEPAARGLRVAGPGDSEEPSRDSLFLPYWMLDRDELLAIVMNQTDPDASDQRLRLTEHLQTLKGTYLIEIGREQDVRTFTADSPIPYRIGHLLQMLKRDDTEKIKQPLASRLDPGPYYGRLTSLISRVEARLADPRFGFIFDPPDYTLRYEWLARTAVSLLEAGPRGTGIKIIDLSEVPSAIVPIVVGALANLVYRVQFWMDPGKRTPACLVCDEAHLYLPAEDSGVMHTAALRAFEAIAKEGRKYGVSLFVVSQRPTDVSRTILSQCNNFLVMRMKNDRDRAIIERLVPETLAGATDSLPVLDVGEALLIGDALPLPTRILLDPPVIKPAGGTLPYWTMWANQPSSSEAIAAGVEALRNQYRPQGTAST